jgi:polar amino acid transport system substrate-binding protein
MKKLVFSFTMLLVFSFNLQAKNLKLAVGLSLPPYIIQSNNTGLEYEVVEAALAAKGHTFTASYVPFARVVVLLNSGEADGALTINEGSGIETFYSNSHVYYQNFAVTLTSKSHAIKSVSDLKSISVASFQNAQKYLGPEFAKVSKANPNYKEYAKQLIQNRLLYKERVDAIVGDKLIFKHFNKEVAATVDTTQKITFHEIFPKTHYKVGFKDKAMRDEFNAGLKTIQSNGTFKKIMSKYGR